MITISIIIAILIWVILIGPIMAWQEKTFEFPEVVDDWIIFSSIFWPIFFPIILSTFLYKKIEK